MSKELIRLTNLTMTFEDGETIWKNRNASRWADQPM